MERLVLMVQPDKTRRCYYRKAVAQWARSGSGSSGRRRRGRSLPSTLHCSKRLHCMTLGDLSEGKRWEAGVAKQREGRWGEPANGELFVLVRSRRIPSTWRAVAHTNRSPIQRQMGDRR